MPCNCTQLGSTDGLTSSAVSLIAPDLSIHDTYTARCLQIEAYFHHLAWWSMLILTATSPDGWSIIMFFLYSINIHNIQYSSGFQSLRSAMPQLTEELIWKRSLVFLAEFRAVAMARKDVCSSEKRLNQWDLCGQIELKVEAMITFHYPELVLF